jgi:hypothetical protein
MKPRSVQEFVFLSWQCASPFAGKDAQKVLKTKFAAYTLCAVEQEPDGSRRPCFVRKAFAEASLAHRLHQRHATPAGSPWP